MSNNSQFNPIRQQGPGGSIAPVFLNRPRVVGKGAGQLSGIFSEFAGNLGSALEARALAKEETQQSIRFSRGQQELFERFAKDRDEARKALKSGELLEHEDSFNQLGRMTTGAEMLAGLYEGQLQDALAKDPTRDPEEIIEEARLGLAPEIENYAPSVFASKALPAILEAETKIRNQGRSNREEAYQNTVIESTTQNNLLNLNRVGQFLDDSKDTELQIKDQIQDYVKRTTDYFSEQNQLNSNLPAIKKATLESTIQFALLKGEQGDYDTGREILNSISQIGVGQGQSLIGIPGGLKAVQKAYDSLEDEQLDAQKRDLEIEELQDTQALSDANRNIIEDLSTGELKQLSHYQQKYKNVPANKIRTLYEASAANLKPANDIDNRSLEVEIENLAYDNPEAALAVAEQSVRDNRATPQLVRRVRAIGEGLDQDAQAEFKELSKVFGNVLPPIREFAIFTSETGGIFEASELYGPNKPISNKYELVFKQRLRNALNQAEDGADRRGIATQIAQDLSNQMARDMEQAETTGGLTLEAIEARLNRELDRPSDYVPQTPDFKKNSNGAFDVPNWAQNQQVFDSALKEYMYGRGPIWRWETEALKKQGLPTNDPSLRKGPGVILNAIWGSSGITGFEE